MTRDGAVLGVLRGSSVHVPPFHLAREAQLSPDAVDGCITELRPGYGYKLLASPDRLIADDLWARLTGGDSAHPITAFLREVIVLNETSSTNDVAAQLGRD